jgi:D-alanyl-D-alanine carboxypeptidase (penicillin-binding protein 5/6)
MGMRRIETSLLALLLVHPAIGAALDGSSLHLPPPRSQLLADATSGQVLRERGADEVLPNGSLDYLMLALLVIERIEAREWQPLQPLLTSRQAVAVKEGRLSLREGDEVAVEVLLRCLIVAKAPEAAVALAEHLTGNLADTVMLMNTRARELAMSHTRYQQLSAVPQSKETGSGVTTARDLARLTLALLRHPTILEISTLSGFPFREGAVLLRNHNRLLGTWPRVDGLFSDGHRKENGDFNLVATGQDAALRLISVTLGALDAESRDESAAQWLDWGFASFERVDIVRLGESIQLPIRVRAGITGRLFPVAQGNFSVLMRRGQERSFELGLQIPDVLAAPIARDQKVGEIVVREREQVLGVVPLVSPADIPATTWSVSLAAGDP